MELSQRIIHSIETSYAEENTSFADIQGSRTKYTQPWISRIGNLLKVAREAGKVETKLEINVETVIHYLQAQEILRTAPVREITNDPILSRIDTNPDLAPNPRFYEIRTPNYTLVLGHKGSQMLLHQEQCQTSNNPDFNEIIRILAESKIRAHAGTPIYTYSPCPNLTIPHAIQTTVYKIDILKGKVTEEILPIRFAESNDNQNAIEISRQINTLKQVEPHKILVLLESLYIPPGLNTETTVGAFAHRQPGMLEISTLGRNQEPIARIQTTTMEVEHKIAEGTWISPRHIIEATERILGGKEPAQGTPMEASLREAIGHIAGSGSGEMIHINLTNRENPIERVLKLTLRSPERINRTRGRRQCNVKNGSDR
jgi:hypothetical protein